jgi:multidrug efflux pump subunit AcrA (membrane-fusion protein)
MAAFAAVFCAATKAYRIFSPLAGGVNRDYDMLRFRIIAAAVVVVAAFTNPVAGEPTGAAALSEAHDCVIEPFIVTELGSPANGILEEILADRGHRVTKGMVVARLRSDLEQASLDLTKARAEATALIELARERVALLKKEVSRNTELHNRQFAATAQLDKSMSELQQAISQLRQTEVDQALAVLEMRRAAVLVAQRSIISPIDGFVIRRLMHRANTSTSKPRFSSLRRSIRCLSKSTCPSPRSPSSRKA